MPPIPNTSRLSHLQHLLLIIIYITQHQDQLHAELMLGRGYHPNNNPDNPDNPDNQRNFDNHGNYNSPNGYYNNTRAACENVPPVGFRKIPNKKTRRQVKKTPNAQVEQAAPPKSIEDATAAASPTDIPLLAEKPSPAHPKTLPPPAPAFTKLATHKPVNIHDIHSLRAELAAERQRNDALEARMQAIQTQNDASEAAILALQLRVAALVESSERRAADVKIMYDLDDLFDADIDKIREACNETWAKDRARASRHLERIRALEFDIFRQCFDSDEEEVQRAPEEQVEEGSHDEFPPMNQGGSGAPPPLGHPGGRSRGRAHRR
ncbi:hypothetical protein B0A55_03034 [Friedmanniomyces simplex]|uniref:Uncharacterized protein n=1 Tax=Friedmanniomyces simplex TaxID=329884 RepID=A0A4U0XRK2_9PEZI|nr:hypothetical protein B0A55_03034 [Friedmanniomyces simplex]